MELSRTHVMLGTGLTGALLAGGVISVVDTPETYERQSARSPATATPTTTNQVL
ncbi:hypothetical protein GVX82_02045, partial [Patescibacteria group bacterium]|nr:hypothetical protein [Patescibacteria group bacterium]